MKSMVREWLGMVFVLEMGVLALLQAQGAYETSPVMGFALLALFSFTILAALGIHRQTRWGWLLGAALSGGVLAVYAWNLLVTYQGLRLDEWFDPYALSQALIALGFVLLAGLLRPWQAAGELDAAAQGSFVKEAAFPLAGLVFMALITFSSLQTGSLIQAAARQADHRHVGSLTAVCRTPLTTLAQLEENYGIKVTLMAVTAMHSMVDVRLKIVDPVKAHALLQNQAAVLVDQKSLILAPHLHTHAKLKPDGMYFMFFPTQKAISSGSELSLVFGAVRVEPITVK